MKKNRCSRSSRLIGKWSKCIAIYLNLHSVVVFHHWVFSLKMWHHLQCRWSCTGHTCSGFSLGDAPSRCSSGRGGMTWGDGAGLWCLGSQWGEEQGMAEQGASKQWARSRMPCHALRAGCSMGFFLPRPVHRQVSPEKGFLIFPSLVTPFCNNIWGFNRTNN